MDSELQNVATQGGECCGGGGCGGGAAASAEAERQEGVTQIVQEHYGAVAERAREGAESNCCGVPQQLYSAEQLRDITSEAQAASAGCGNPAGLAEASEGETVLDLGSGGGIDCFLAARKVGPRGKVIGLDMTPEMVRLAQENAAKLGADNVTFKLGRLESITERDSSVDLIISNCVISLVEDKDAVFAEMMRVLKPGGRFVIADMVADAPMPDDVRGSRRQWVACIAGADQRQRFLERIRKAGFASMELLEDRKAGQAELQGSAASISSITVRAVKPA